jgi:MFS family permease
VLCVSLLIVTLDNTVLNVVLPTLVRDLHATTSQLQWIVDAYVMVFAGLLLAAGSVADRVGRKRTFLAGLAAFAAGSAWAAFSGSVGLLIAARASMGIGAALIMPSTLSIITDMFRDGAKRQRAIGLWAGTSGVGIAISSVGLVTFGLFGALFVLTQYLQFELGYTALQAGVRVLPAPPSTRPTWAHCPA